MPSKTPGVSKKGRNSQRGRGKGGGRCITASAAASRRSSVALLVARWTNNRKVVSSRPTKVVWITVLTGNSLGWTVRCSRPPLLLPSCRKLEFRLSALMDSDLAWVNGKSARQSWCCADAFQRSIISGAIYHLHFTSVADPDAIHGATEPQLQTAAERAEAKVHDSGEDTDSTSVASASQKMKIMKVSADLSAEEEQTMTALVLRQWSHCYVLIKFLLRPHSTTSSLRFLSMSKIRPRPPRSWRHGDHTTYLSVCTAFLLRCTSSYCVH